MLGFFFLACVLSWSTARAQKYLEQSFFFNYRDNSGQITTTPVTSQCDTIHLTWERSTATGPNPVAPYVLQIYTSAFIVPFVVPAGSNLALDWAVPFAPGTQYQICMFDSNGNTGGCQDIYTVIPSTNLTGIPSCANVTFPAGAMDVTGTVASGPLSQNGWVDQCTDISVLPNNGTPPYIFTVAPTLRPPYNITTNSMTSMNWTVELSWASSFFLSVVDSAGNMWANGPIHSANSGNTSTKCLDVNEAVSSTTGKKSSTAPGPYIGAGVGGVALGLLVGILSACCFLRCRRRSSEGTYDGDGYTYRAKSPTALDVDTQPMSSNVSHYRTGSTVPFSSTQLLDSSLSSGQASNSTMLNRGSRSGQYQIEPFAMPGETGSLHERQTQFGASTAHGSLTPQRSAADTPAASQQDRSQVYVVHHDGGRAPVTVYTSDGTEVVELPPRYVDGQLVPAPAPGGSPSDALSERHSSAFSDGPSEPGRSEAQSLFTQPRRPGQVRKPQEVVLTARS